MNKKLLSLVLLTSFLVLGGCNSSNGGGSNIPKINDVVKGDEARYITNGIHKFDIKKSDNVLVTKPFQMGVDSDYKIVYDTDTTQKDKSLKAAQFISKNILEATGMQIPVVMKSDETKCRLESKFIYVGCNDIFLEASLTMPEEDLGISGYYIKSYRKCCFIEVERTGGYQMGAICFCKEVVGYDYYTDDFATYNDMNVDNVYLPDMEIIEVPDFDCRNYVNNGSAARLYALGYTTSGEIFIPIGGNAMHNCNQWLPFDKYSGKHRGWFADTQSAAGKGLYQLCYTAHGNENEFDAMVDECLTILEEYSAKYPSVENVTLTQLDAPDTCTCETCNKVVEEDGAISATIIRFMNALDTKFRAKHPDSKLNLLFFAYQSSLAAPSKTIDEDPTLKCHEHVFPIIAPINANYTRSFYDEVNEQYANNFTAWSKYCSKFCAWIYECNYKHYMYPYNSYQPMVDTYKFLKQYNTAIMYNEGQRYNTAVTCFGRFKDYIDSKLNVNVNVSFDELKKTFFSNYYGDAGKIMEQLFDEIRNWTEYVEQNYLPDPGYLYEQIDQESFWPKPLLEHYLDLCEDAYEAIAPLRNKNINLYNVFHDHINIETMFPRFALCDLYAYLFDEDVIEGIRNEFKDDCSLLGFQEYCEVHPGYPAGSQGWMSEKFAEWGMK